MLANDRTKRSTHPNPIGPDSQIGTMNSLRFKALICSATTLFVCTASRAQAVKAPDRFDPDRLDAYLAAQVREKGRVGLSVAIVQRGQVVLAKAYGSRSLQEH